MKRKHHYNDDDFENGMLRDGKTYRAGSVMFMDSHREQAMKQNHDNDDLLQDYASAHLTRVHDGTGDSGLSMHRPGFRVTDAPQSDELQRARDAYEHGLRTAWRRGAQKDNVVPNAPKASGSDAMPVDDIESANRLYAEEISEAWKTLR